MPTEPERDPVEWAQHTALVAISVARTVLDLAEAAVADRERLERLATSGRSFAETWLGDAARAASTVVSGFGYETEAKQTSPPPPPAPAAEQPAASPGAAPTAAAKASRPPVKRATAASRSKPVKDASNTAAKPRKATTQGPKKPR